MELTRALGGDKPTVGVEVHRTGRVKEHKIRGIMGCVTEPDEKRERGRATPGGAR